MILGLFYDGTKFIPSEFIINRVNVDEASEDFFLPLSYNFVSKTSIDLVVLDLTSFDYTVFDIFLFIPFLPGLTETSLSDLILEILISIVNPDILLNLPTKQELIVRNYLSRNFRNNNLTYTNYLGISSKKDFYYFIFKNVFVYKKDFINFNDVSKTYFYIPYLTGSNSIFSFSFIGYNYAIYKNVDVYEIIPEKDLALKQNIGIIKLQERSGYIPSNESLGQLTSEKYILFNNLLNLSDRNYNLGLKTLTFFSGMTDVDLYYINFLSGVIENSLIPETNLSIEWKSYNHLLNLNPKEFLSFNQSLRLFFRDVLQILYNLSVFDV